MFDKTQWVWMNGEMIAWNDAQVHASTHTVSLRHRRFRGHSARSH
jgi:branched-subunit amino acid aminotransferase/4-amino-4-deoxychorismate lyase